MDSDVYMYIISCMYIGVSMLEFDAARLITYTAVHGSHCMIYLTKLATTILLLKLLCDNCNCGTDIIQISRHLCI